MLYNKILQLPPEEFKEFARLARMKQAVYEEQRREHTNRVRASLRERRDYEMTWARTICET